MSTHSHEPSVALDPSAAAAHSTPDAPDAPDVIERSHVPRHPHIPRQAIASEARTAWYHTRRAVRLLGAELTRSVADVYRTLCERLAAATHRGASS